MKNKKLFKLSFSIILVILMTISNVFAVNKAIEMGSAGNSGKYIANTHYSKLYLKSGKQVYCLEAGKTPTENVTATLVNNSSRLSGGLKYILKNGYPEKSFTKDSDLDFYITQTAVWLYLDEVTGSHNIGEGIRSTGSDPHNLRPYINKLLSEGLSHKNDSTQVVSPELNITTKNSKMVITEGYYLSDSITVTTNNQSATITLKNIPNNTKIVKQDNTEFIYSKEFTVNNNETFKVKIPTSSVLDSTSDIKIEANTTAADYQIYEYQPPRSDMQNVVLLEKENKKATKELTLSIENSIVTIVKVDTNTKQPLAGATLVLKDSNGKEITRWESTINGHVIKNLANGDYTIEEISATKGYLLNHNVAKFTVSESKKELKVLFENAPKNVVVNINKVDKETNAPLAGAVLIVKKNNQEIARFTTTTSSYVLTDLEDGTYTVEELSAPAGYIKSNEIRTFVIDDQHLSHQITIVNSKEVIVPDTDSTTSLLLFLLGISIIGAGLGFVYKNGKQA